MIQMYLNVFLTIYNAIEINKREQMPEELPVFRGLLKLGRFCQPQTPKLLQ